MSFIHSYILWEWVGNKFSLIIVRRNKVCKVKEERDRNNREL